MAGRSDLAAQLERVRLESDTLYAIISAVGSSVDLTRVLDGIVELVTEATDCHACFVYLRDGDRLRIRAASRIYAHVVGKVEFALDEGLTGWVARTGEPAFIREDALVGPAHEVRARARGGALPVDGRRPDARPLGRGAGRRRAAHRGPARVRRGRAQLPRAHRVARGGRDRERAALRGDAAARRRAHEPRRAERAHRRGRAGARSSTSVVTAGVRRLLGCDASQLWLRDGEDGRLELVAFDPPGRAARAARRVARRRCATTATSSARWSPCARGVRTLPGPAPGAAAGRRQPGRPGAAQRRAHRAPDRREPGPRALRGARRRRARHRRGPRARRRLRSRPPARLHPRRARWRPARRRRPGPPSPSASRRGCARSRPARSSTPAATRCAGCSRWRPERERGDIDPLRELGAERGRGDRHERGAHGRRRRRARDCARRATPARIARALSPAGGALAYDGLGAYRYLVHLALDDAPHDRLCEAVERLLEYDERRETQLLGTLEQYLADRRVGTTTARQALHPCQHAAPAAGPDREADRARPRDGGPAVARARAQARAPVGAPAAPSAASRS